MDRSQKSDSIPNAWTSLSLSPLFFFSTQQNGLQGRNNRYSQRPRNCAEGKIVTRCYGGKLARATNGNVYFRNRIACIRENAVCPLYLFLFSFLFFFSSSSPQFTARFDLDQKRFVGRHFRNYVSREFGWKRNRKKEIKKEGATKSG